MAGVFTALFGLARHWPPQPGDVRTVFTFAAVLLPAAGEVRTCLGRRLHTVLLRIHRRLVPLPSPPLSPPFTPSHSLPMATAAVWVKTAVTRRTRGPKIKIERGSLAMNNTREKAREKNGSRHAFPPSHTHAFPARCGTGRLPGWRRRGKSRHQAAAAAAVAAAASFGIKTVSRLYRCAIALQPPG